MHSPTAASDPHCSRPIAQQQGPVLTAHELPGSLCTELGQLRRLLLRCCPRYLGRGLQLCQSLAPLLTHSLHRQHEVGNVRANLQQRSFVVINARIHHANTCTRNTCCQQYIQVCVTQADIAPHTRVVCRRAAWHSAATRSDVLHSASRLREHKSTSLITRTSRRAAKRAKAPERTR